MKKLLLILLTGTATACVTSCLSDNQLNPFVCKTENGVGYSPMQSVLYATKIDSSYIESGENLGTIKVDATAFKVDANYLNIINVATNKLTESDKVLVVYTNIDACNSVQYAYAKLLVTTLVKKGLKTDRVLFVDAKTNELLRSESSGKVASVSMSFVIVNKKTLNK